jgi:hypothetical protein
MVRDRSESRGWTIPAERVKAGKEHRVPLTEPAVQLLETLPREGSSADSPASRCPTWRCSSLCAAWRPSMFRTASAPHSAICCGTRSAKWSGKGPSRSCKSLKWHAAGRGEFYIVTGKMSTRVLDTESAVFTLYIYVSRGGALRLWPIRQAGSDQSGRSGSVHQRPRC